MFYLALSCLQGRPMKNAALELLSLGPQGIQLTPGNLPTPHFAWQLRGTNTLRHHGFCWTARKLSKVWADDGTCLSDADSVHPPKSDHPGAKHWMDASDDRIAYETMYPSYELGTGLELERAMAMRLFLAVDVSHIYLQSCANVLTEATWKRLQNYDRISEVHVSQNGGRRDTHRPIEPDTFGLSWAREKLKAGTPVVLESYFHRLSIDQRKRQVDLVLGKVLS